METVEASELEAPVFTPWPKIARLNRDIVITEKIDGSNACVIVTQDGRVFAQSRTRLIEPTKSKDNFGFAQWVKFHEKSLAMLGPGHHFGEWWGIGIQRGYGLSERRFSLFNTKRWTMPGQAEILAEVQVRLPNLYVVPVLYEGPWDTGDGVGAADSMISYLRGVGSRATVSSPDEVGFKPAEGIVVFHKASGQSYKVTLENDAEFKGGKRDAHENVVAEAA